MSTIWVSASLFVIWGMHADMRCLESSIYQDVPLHTLEEFLELAPEELRSQEAENEHQLMLNRLSFELSERQR